MPRSGLCGAWSTRVRRRGVDHPARRKTPRSSSAWRPLSIAERFRSAPGRTPAAQSRCSACSRPGFGSRKVGQYALSQLEVALELGDALLHGAHENFGLQGELLRAEREVDRREG